MQRKSCKSQVTCFEHEKLESIIVSYFMLKVLWNYMLRCIEIFFQLPNNSKAHLVIENVVSKCHCLRRWS